MELIDKLDYRLKQGQKIKIVFPEGNELRILQGVSMANKKGFLEAYVIGNAETMDVLVKENELDMEGVHFIDIITTKLIDKYADNVTRIANFPSPMVAKALLKNPNNLAAAMLRLDDYDALLSGVISATSEVVTGCKMILGMEEGYKLTSGLMIADCPHFKREGSSIVIMSDPSDNIDPTAEEMAEIAIVTAKNAEKITGCQSKVAMLSFSTYGSAKAPEAEKVIKATKIVREKEPDILVDGELQLDAAVNPTVARMKLKDRVSEVAGWANVLIYPDLNAGNIGIKIMVNFGDAISLGVVIQGFKKPVADMSRGSNSEEIRDMISVLASMVEF